MASATHENGTRELSMKADGEYPWRDLINWNCFKYLLIKRVLMLMNARSTPMTVTPMQSALTQKAHLLASATWMHITLVTGQYALLIVSRIICFTSLCSLRFTTLPVVNLCGKSYPPIFMSPKSNLSPACRLSWLCSCPRIYSSWNFKRTTSEIFLLIFLLLLTFVGR